MSYSKRGTKSYRKKHAEKHKQITRKVDKLKNKGIINRTHHYLIDED